MTTATNVLLAVLGLATGVLAARLFGTQGRGELAAIQTWPSFFATISMIGLPVALLYYSAKDPDRAGRYLGTVMTLTLLLSVPFMAVGYVAMPFLLSAQSEEVIFAARWYLLLVPLFALVGLPFNPLQGRNDFAVWNMLRITPNVGWLAVLVMVWAIGRAEPVFAAASYLTVLALLFFPVAYTVWRRVPGSFRPEIRNWGPMLRFGLPSAVSSVPQMLNLRLDQMLMVAFLPAQSLGLYVVAVAWGNISHPILAALGNVLLPRVASQETLEERVWAFAQGTRLAVLISLLVNLVFMVLTPLIIPVLFGEEFAEAIPAALVLVFAGSIAGLNLVMENGIRGLGKPVYVMWAEFSGLAVTAVALALLLRPLGIMGAAVASALGYTAIAIILIAQARILTVFPLRTLLFPTMAEINSSLKRVQALVGNLKEK